LGGKSGEEKAFTVVVDVLVLLLIPPLSTLPFAVRFADGHAAHTKKNVLPRRKG
jgi:hypothetical protein